MCASELTNENKQQTKKNKNTNLSLQVHGRIPVRIVKHDGVRSCEVDADAARARAEDEGEDLAVGVRVEQLTQRRGERVRNKQTTRKASRREERGSQMSLIVINRSF